MSIGDVTNQGRNGNAQNAISMARNMQQMAQQFMNLFMTEMTHQLPDKPLDQSQLLQALAAQTSVATSVGQLQIAGENNALQADQLALSAQQFLGKQVLIKTTKFYVEHKKGNIDLQYDLTANVGKATITIKDNNGNIVYQGNAPDTSQGRKTFSWDHRIKQKNGKPGDLLPAGNYTISIDLKDKDGKDLHDDSGSSVTPDIYAPQTITEIDYNSGTGNGDASVMVVYGNNIRTPLGDIERVYQPQKPIATSPIPPLQKVNDLLNHHNYININNHNLYNKHSWNIFGFKSNNRSMLKPALENQNLDISNNPSTLNANNQYLLYLHNRNHENIITESNKNKHYKKTHMVYNKSLQNAFQINEIQK